MDKPSFYTFVPPRSQSPVSSKTKYHSNNVLAHDQEPRHHAKDFYLAQEKKTDPGYGLERSDDGHSLGVAPIRKPRASFSGFSHAVDDLRSISRRLAAQKRKGFPFSSGPREMKLNETFDEVLCEDEELASEFLGVEQDNSIQPGSLRWLRCCLNTRFRHRRRTIETPLRPTPSHWAHQEPRISPAPGSGAAARAAAAAQNEAAQNEGTQNEASEGCRRARTKEREIRGDSESGIGIDVRTEECVTAIIRRDPMLALPKELITHILSYLDAKSLIQSELVSQQWHNGASDPLVWKEVFLNDFRPRLHSIPDESNNFQIGGLGLGDCGASQDWKTMWKTRKALHQRWVDGHAAAIYLEGHYDSVYCVQFDEDKILTGSRDRSVRIWDAHTYKCIKVLGVPVKNEPPVLPPLTSTCGRRPFTRIFSQQFKVYPECKRPEWHHVGSILCLQYDEQLMITGSSDCTCIMWDVKADWTPIRRVRYHSAGVLDVCFDQKHVVSCSKDTTVCLWDRQTGDLIHRLNGHRGPVNAVQLRGNLAVSASGDGIAKLWNLPSGNCVKEFLSKDRGMACVEFSMDSRSVFAGGNDRVTYQFDASTGELIRELKGHLGLVRSLHLDSASGRVISGSYDKSVRAYDVFTGESIIDFTGWTASWILSAKTDFRRIIATSQDGRAIIIDFGFNLPGIDLLEGKSRSGADNLGRAMRNLRIER